MRTTPETNAASGPQPKDWSQCLPTEVISSILDTLVAEEQCGTLAKTARASQRMYDVVIPKLYDTIHITERNRLNFTYGCTMADLSLPDGTSYYCRVLMSRLPHQRRDGAKSEGSGHELYWQDQPRDHAIERSCSMLSSCQVRDDEIQPVYRSCSSEDGRILGDPRPQGHYFRPVTRHNLQIMVPKHL